MSSKEIARQIESIDGMVRALEKTTDPVLRTKAQDLVQALMELHGSCLEQMLEIVRSSGEPGNVRRATVATLSLHTASLHCHR